MATHVLDKVSIDTLKLDRDEMVHQLGTRALSSSRVAPPKEERLLDSVSSLSKPQMCSTSELSKHLLRVTTKLWKTLVFGTGESDLAWANPASIMPLRVHAFGSLLQILGSASLYMLKSGVTQIDGASKFDLATLGNILALLFDEEDMFGPDVTEVLGELDSFAAEPAESAKEAKSSDKTPTSTSDDPPCVQEQSDKPKRFRRHQRNTFEFSRDSVDMSDPTSRIGDVMLGASSLPTRQSERMDSFEEVTIASAPSPVPRVSPVGIETSTVLDLGLSHLSPPSRPKAANIKIDSVSDFRSNMELGLQNESSEDSFDGPLSASNVSSIMQTFGGLSGVGRNRWRTAPAPNLKTIREDEVGDEDPGGSPLPLIQPSPSGDGQLDSVDSELILNQKKGPKQMRVPLIRGKSAPTETSQDLSAIADRAAESSNEPTEKNQDLKMIANKATASSNDRKYYTLSGPPQSARMKSPVSQTLPKTYDEITSAGSAFLDSLGTSLGGLR